MTAARIKTMVRMVLAKPAIVCCSFLRKILFPFRFSLLAVYAAHLTAA
jgi:hypothetical protein